MIDVLKAIVAVLCGGFAMLAAHRMVLAICGFHLAHRQYGNVPGALTVAFLDVGAMLAALVAVIAVIDRVF